MVVIRKCDRMGRMRISPGYSVEQSMADPENFSAPGLKFCR